MTRTLHGKVQGKTILLEEEPAELEGQKVEIHLRLAQPTRSYGEGVLKTAGALSDDPYWDDIMSEIHQARKKDRSQAGGLE